MFIIFKIETTLYMNTQCERNVFNKLFKQIRKVFSEKILEQHTSLIPRYRYRDTPISNGYLKRIVFWLSSSVSAF